MTRFSLSELRVKKMEESKRKNTTESEDILTLCGAAEEKAKSGESLQDAFKKFRKKRQVNFSLVSDNIICLSVCCFS